MSDIPSSDLRSSSRDYKRDAAHKHKWALGAQETLSRGEDNPRPKRIRDRGPPHRLIERTYGSVRRARRHAASNNSPDPEDVVDGGYPSEEEGVYSEINTSGGGSSSDENTSAAAAMEGVPASPSLARMASVAENAGIMYSFDAPRGPSQGSQILNVALAKAVEKFEEKETAKLVKNEYDVLDSEGESVGAVRAAAGAGKKGKFGGKKVAWAEVAAGKVMPPPVKVQEAVYEDEEYEFV